MSTQIVVVNVNEQLAPLPASLQQFGAFISQGGTTLTPGTFQALTTQGALAAILQPAGALSGITQTGGTATATTAQTTLSSGSYDDVSGNVTLTLTEDIGIVADSTVVVSGATGTGAFADINGTFPCIDGTGAGTVVYNIADSLTLTITGAAVNIGLVPQVGDTFLTTIAGAVPAAYNGTFEAAAATATTFTYSIPATTATPATGTPTYTGRNVAELASMNSTWWAQGNAGNLAPYVLELGAGEDATAVAALGTYLTANPNINWVPGATGFFYSYLVPRSWADSSDYLELVALCNNPTARTKFFTTMDLDNYADFDPTNTSVIGLVESPNALPTEFQLASAFFVTLNYTPTTTSKVPPLNNAFVYGLTPYPLANNSALFDAFKAAGVNWISTGAQGGLTSTTFVYGTTMDATSFNASYSVDWAQITTKVATANAVINGSNNTVNPLYYDQSGINTLQSVAASNLQTGISSGLILGTLIQTELDQTTFLKNVNAGSYTGNCVINAVPFQTWLNANPDNYAEGVYGGFSILMTPQLGFTQVVFNLDVTEFA